MEKVKRENCALAVRLLAALLSAAPATSLDGGVTFRLRANAQLDLAAGVELSRAAADRFATVGFSLRLPG